MRHFVTALLVPIFVACFAAAALASGGQAPGLESELRDILNAIYNGFKAGEFGKASAALVIFAVALLRRYGAKIRPWLGNANAARVYLLLATAAGYLYANGVELGNIEGALMLAAAVGGGVNLIQWAVEWALGKSWLPGWAALALRGVLWLFRGTGEDAIQEAEKAGNDAVRNSPPKGVGRTGTWP